jgi:hypothetical protein
MNRNITNLKETVCNKVATIRKLLVCKVGFLLMLGVSVVATAVVMTGCEKKEKECKECQIVTCPEGQHLEGTDENCHCVDNPIPPAHSNLYVNFGYSLWDGAYDVIDVSRETLVQNANNPLIDTIIFVSMEDFQVYTDLAMDYYSKYIDTLFNMSNNKAIGRKVINPKEIGEGYKPEVIESFTSKGFDFIPGYIHSGKSGK